MKRPAFLLACVSVSGALFSACANGQEDLPSQVALDAGQSPGEDSGTNAAPSSDAEPDETEPPVKDAGSDKDGGWPTCDTMPASAAAKSIPDLFAASASAPTFVWIEHVFVTAVSRSTCGAGQACQIFVQDASYSSLQIAAQHAIRIFVSAAAAEHFTSIAVNDRIDVAGYAWRYNIGGANEVLIEITDKLPGCAKKTSSGTITPVTGVQLSDLTVDAYENTLGPVLVEIAHVSGRPDASSSKTFGLWPTVDAGGFDAGPSSEIVSLSPFFLQGSAFSGMTPGVTTRFATITGVFGLFVPPVDSGAPIKYLEIYPRTAADIVD